VLSGCGSARYTQVPARQDLQPYGRIALVTFTAEAADTAMSRLATQHFAESVLASQSGIELLELNAADSVRRLLDRDASAAARAIGRDSDVPAVFAGRLVLSNVKPKGGLSGAGITVKAGVTAELTVSLLSSKTGGTVWRSSATANGQVARVNVTAGLPSVAMRDPEAAYGELVRALVERVTHDFRPTFVKQ
jgi:hypothetical protein